MYWVLTWDDLQTCSIINPPTHSAVIRGSTRGKSLYATIDMPQKSDSVRLHPRLTRQKKVVAHRKGLTYAFSLLYCILLLMPV